jgi:hypothetical protein
MIIHIFKKDVRLLWRIVLLVAVLQFISTAMFFQVDRSPSGRNPYGLLLQMVLFVSLLARAILIVLCVQQDPIPGVSQDWLSRPVNRLHLLMAKLLFVAVLAQGPLLLADLVQGCASGFPFNASLEAALTRSLYYLVMFALPFVAFGSLTRNLTQAIAAGVIAFLLLAGGKMLTVGISEGRQILMVNPTTLTGMEWMQDALRTAVIIAAVGFVLALQYRWRKTMVSGGVLLMTGVLAVLAPYLPWSIAYATQQALSAKPGTKNQIDLRFDPAKGDFDKASGVSESLLRGLYGDNPDADMIVYLPIQVSGLPADGFLKNDRTVASLITVDGKRIELGVSGDFQSPPRANDSSVYYPLAVRADLYSRYKDRPVSLELAYWVTLMRIDETAQMRALNGQTTMRAVGRCKTKLNGAETNVEVHCLEPGGAAQCLTAILENPAKNLRNPMRVSCTPNYAAFTPHPFPDGMSRVSFTLPFRDPSHPGEYALQGKDLPDSRVLITSYRPEEHFQRQVVIPDLRLSDWLPR